MTSEKVLEVAQKYYAMLLPRYKPIRLPEDYFAVPREYHHSDRIPYLQHACYMSQQISVHILNGKNEKAMRWLGYLQCLLNITGATSLSEAKADNMPSDEQYNRDA